MNYKQIIAEQREEITVINKRGWVPRTKEKAIEINNPLAQIIIGVRRSGKSTLAHRALRGINYAYINFDDERLAGINSDQLNLLLEALYSVYGEFDHLMLDEIQNVEGWHLFVNRMLRSELKIILTGSNSKLLSSDMASHLTGRYSTVELFPFSFHEFLIAKGKEDIGAVTARERGLLNALYDEYSLNGGFPDIVEGQVSYNYISDLFVGIVTRDVIFRHNIRHIRTFRDLATYLTGNFASEISFNRLKNIFGLGSENTAKNYISYLEESYLVRCLPKFSFKKQESLRYRKIYLIDTAFSQVSGNKFTPDHGRILENIVFLELARNACENRYELFYYKKQYEVDFVIYSNRKVIELIQVTRSITDRKTLKRELRALLIAANELKAEKLTIITQDDHNVIHEEGKEIRVVSITEWLINRGSRKSGRG